MDSKALWGIRVRVSVCVCVTQFIATLTCRASQVALVAKHPPASEGDIRDVGSIPGLGRSLGGGHGNSLQYFCLENPMDRRGWQATVHRVTKTWTQLKALSRCEPQVCGLQAKRRLLTPV